MTFFIFHFIRIREDRSRADRMLGVDRDSREDGMDSGGGMSPHHKTNGKLKQKIIWSENIILLMKKFRGLQERWR